MGAGERCFYSRRELCVRLRYGWRQLRELAAHAGAHYKSFDVGQGNKLRHIDIPQQPLKEIQSRIALMLKSRIKFPPTMLGGVEKGSPKRNAQAHLGQRLVFKLDIRNCFPSIGNKRIFRVFREQLRFSDEISRILTQLRTLA